LTEPLAPAQPAVKLMLTEVAPAPAVVKTSLKEVVVPADILLSLRYVLVRVPAEACCKREGIKTWASSGRTSRAVAKCQRVKYFLGVFIGVCNILYFLFYS
jgi:hypothetical protein